MPTSYVVVDVGISPTAETWNGSVVTPPTDLTLNLIFCPVVFSITPSSPVPAWSIYTAKSFAAPTVNPTSPNLTTLVKFALPESAYAEAS